MLDGEKFLKSEFSAKTRATIVPVIQRGYSLAEEFVKQFDCFNWLIGKEGLSYIRNIAVNFEVKKSLDTGILPFEYKIAPNKRGNCHHLEIFTSNSIVTISQLRNEKSVPRKAYFRSNLSLNNQVSLDDFRNFDYKCYEPVKPNEPFYVILTHGYGGSMPDFINLGLPQPGANQWISKINLLQGVHSLDVPEEEIIINADDLLQFKDHINGQDVLVSEES